MTTKTKAPKRSAKPKMKTSRITIEADVKGPQPIYVEGEEAKRCYVRIPISAAIPTQQQAGAPPDERNRMSNKIMIKGFRVRGMVSYSGTIRAMALAYENLHQTSVVGLNGSPPGEFFWG